MEFSFWNGEFPQLLPRDSIAMVLCGAGVMEVVGGIGLGWLSDRYGRTRTVLIGAVAYASGLYLTTRHLLFEPNSMVQPTWHDMRVPAYIAAGCFGLADSAYNLSIYSLLGEHYAHSGTLVFTAFNFVGSCGMSVGFGSQLYTPLHGSTGTRAQIYVQTMLLIMGTTGFFMCEWHWTRTKASGARAGAQRAAQTVEVTCSPPSSFDDAHASVRGATRTMEPIDSIQ
jgi:MFS family permease